MFERESLLLTDLYQLNMMQAYEEQGMTDTAVFELFFRKLPPRRGFLMAAGLAQVVEFLSDLQFLPSDLDYLKLSDRFAPWFIERLSTLRFTGDVDAMPEGTVFFPDEPILRIAAPLPLAQLVETRIMNLAHFQTLVASKAARMVLAAPGKRLVDFGLRRAHGAEAGLMAARASYVAGFDGTATTLAAPAFSIPIYGTMAHSFIQTHDTEEEAFFNFARARPDGLVLLIDTYDTERAARKVVDVAARLGEEGIEVRGVRIDSGDLGAHARKVRAILDAGGMSDIIIFASGGLDEDRLLQLERAKAPIDGYGIGTSLVTSSDVPALDCAYKLQEYAGLPRRKHSEGKSTWPGRKQVWRQASPDGVMSKDTLTVEGDVKPGAALLQPVMRDGKPVAAAPTLDAIRQHAKNQLVALPAPLRHMEIMDYPVHVAPALRDLAEACDVRIAARLADAGLSGDERR
ncbi:MAG: nicotinate phosphoribosyltransferase [Alphaproteobacteria bacterium]